MIDSLFIALSGLTAQKQRLGAAASNIANAGTAGVIPDASAGGVSTVYTPLRVDFTSREIGGRGGGVAAIVSPETSGYAVVYDPSSIYAGKDGLIAVPNVDLTAEAVTLMETKLAFRANVSVIKAQKEMMGEILDTIA
jgi:flagellar basal-body rod protein FlgC